jgi:hypothetical protein
MKIRSDIRAGDALSDCQRQRDYWKAQATRMEQIANGPGPSNPPTYPPTYPPTNPPTSGGGWVGGTYYADRSGWCG